MTFHLHSVLRADPTLESNPSNSTISAAVRGYFLNSMASLVDSRPTLSPTPPIDTSHYPALPVDNPSSHPDINPGAYSPPIKTTTNTLPPAPQSAASNPSSPGLEIPGAYPREPREGASASTGATGPGQKQNIPEMSREQPNPPTAIPRHLCTPLSDVGC